MQKQPKDTDEIFELLIKEAQRPFYGWDFSYIANRSVTAPLTWSYTTEILPILRKANSLLDMGTGGGEFFSFFQPFPKKTFATEAYEPNVSIAKKTLEPLGVKVLQIYGDENLPFEDNFFNLIINRHESYSHKEVLRILEKGGIFLTQQVGGDNDDGLREFFLNDKRGEYHHWNLHYASEELENNGFIILKKKECFPITRFFDIGAIVFYLLAAPWEIPDFTVNKFKDKLFELHEIITKKGYIDYTSHRFLIKSQKV